MNNRDAADSDRAAIMRTTADLLAAVNASDELRILGRQRRMPYPIDTQRPV